MPPMRLPTPTTPHQLADSERDHVNGQVYNTRSVLFSRHGEPNSTNSPCSSADLQNAGSLNPDQRHGSSISHSDKERPPVEIHNHTVSNIALRERQTSASASPHDMSRKSTYSTVLRRRATADDSPTSSDESRQDISFPRKHTNSEARRKENEALLLEKARQSLVEAKRLAVGARHAESSAKMREVAAQKREFEAKYKEAEAKMQEVEAQRRLDAARRRELEARRKEEEAKRNEEEVKRNGKQATKREKEIQLKEMDALKWEDNLRRREDDTRKREEDARQREILARQKEEDAHRFEEEARRKEAARRKEEAGQRNKRFEEDCERMKREIEQKEAELRKREIELLRKEQAARLAQEEATRQTNESFRRKFEEATREDEDSTRLKAEKETARPQEDASNRVAEKAEIIVPEQEKQPKARGRKGSKVQTKSQKDKGLEERRQEELEEQRRLEEQRCLEERQRPEEYRRLEELQRAREERPNRRALLYEILAEAPGNRLLEEQQRGVEKERHRVNEEQRCKVDEENRQGEHQQQQHQDDILRQRVKEGFEQREAQYYQRTLERERVSLESRAGHRIGYSAPFVIRYSANSTWSSRRSHVTPSLTSLTIPLSTAPRALPAGVRPGAPGTSPHTSKLDEVEWARRAEERARQQQEQFKREQERMENERQAKGTKVLSREELIRLFENHDNKWRQLRDSDNLGWNSFAWPVFKRPSEPEEMTTSAISAYVLSKYGPDANTKSPKDRIKDQLKRWHPDKFETRILPRVAEDEREKVKTGAGVVVRGLNEMLNRNYED